MDYKSGNSGGKVFNRRVRDRICDLSRALSATQNVEHFKRTLTQFYKEFGVGKLGLHKAFRVEHPENSVWRSYRSQTLLMYILMIL